MEKLAYLVCIPQGPLYHCAKKIQNYLWEKYNLGSGPKPELHLTIDAFYYEDIDELEEIKRALNKIINHIQPFEIHSSGFSFIPEPYNCITIHVVKNEALKNIYYHIHTLMKRKGLKVRAFSPEEIVFHISLAGVYGREWSEDEIKQAWMDIKDFQVNEISLIKELQLWFAEKYDAESRVISKFQLKDIVK